MTSSPPDVKQAAATFCATFKMSCQEATSALADPSSDRNAILQTISTLSKDLVAATVYLPTYDQRQCNSMLKALQDQMNTTNPPRQKFSFASRRAQAKPAHSTVATGSPPSLKSTGQLATVVAPSEAPSEPPPRTTTSRTISDVQHQRIILPASTTEESSRDHELAGLKNCVVSLLDASVAAIHASNLENCLIFVGPVGGSVLIESCRSCVFVLTCRQFRMHNTTQTTILLQINSHPIIEDCSGIRFAPYPRDRLLAHHSEALSSARYAAASIDPAEESNKVGSVEDFKWLRRGQSPNWCLVDGGLPGRQVVEVLAGAEDWKEKLVETLAGNNTIVQ
ncbi:hypothetical protein HKX48_000806 [Thoreauomyces humboldtii]|nr:hypothetical protein HKX48_000806 [Thoreauomyces humboldtii]